MMRVELPPTRCTVARTWPAPSFARYDAAEGTSSPTYVLGAPRS